MKYPLGLFFLYGIWNYTYIYITNILIIINTTYSLVLKIASKIIQITICFLLMQEFLSVWWYCLDERFFLLTIYRNGIAIETSYLYSLHLRTY